MTCHDALDAMLTASPAELRGEGASPLAFHVRECGRCRAVARTILSEQAALDAAMAAAEPPRPAGAVADAVLETARAEGVAPGQDTDADVVPGTGKRGPVGARLRSWKVAVPTLLAAVLAALLLFPRDDRDWQVPAGAGPAVRGERVAVSPPPDKSVAVFQTRNPNIKVIWFY